MIRSLDIHRRALAAAMAVVGRHRHAAGVAAMSVALSGTACLPDKDDVGGSEVTSASEATTEGSTSWDDTALSDATGMDSSGSDSDWGTTTTTTTTATTGDPSGSSSSGTGESATGEGTTGDPTEGTTADTTTGDTTGDTTGQGTDGELSDCVDEEGNTDWECCAAQDWQPPEHCTPWGPPAPPRFDPASSPRLRPRVV